MSHPVYMVPAGDTLPVLFDTFDGGTGASITMTGLAVTDIEIYKDGSVTQRASDAGYTLLDTDGIDFDGITGIHGFSIDTGDNTDAGFYTVGSWFHVVVSAITVDAQTVNFVACAFRLMAAEGVAGVPVADTTHISGDSTAADNLETAFDDTAGSVPWNGIIDQGTAQSATATTLVLRAAAAFANDVINDATIVITGGSAGVGQRRAITNYDSATDTATVDTWDETPAGTITYKIFGSAPASSAVPTPVNVTQWNGTAVATPTVAGVPEVDLTHVAGSTTSVSVLATNVAAILVDTAEIGAAGAGLTEAGGTGDQLTALATAAALTTVDTVVDAIKVQTDKLTFTVANQVDANLQSINDVTLVGDGSATPFNV